MLFQVPPPESLQGHFLSIALPIILSFLAKEFWASRRERSRDNKLAVLLTEYRLHRHDEKKGALTAEGVTYPRTNGDR